MKIGIIHTAISAIQPMMEAVFAVDPTIQISNYLNEELFNEVNANGYVEKATLRNFSQLLFSAAASDINGIIIACSVFCPYVPLLQNFIEIPMIAVDDPMLEKAVQHGHTVGLIATNATAIAAPKTKALRIAKELGKVINIQSKIVADAAVALRKGDKNLHDQLISQATEDLMDRNCDTIVLCQISMARAKDSIKNGKERILTSTEEGAVRIIELIKNK